MGGTRLGSWGPAEFGWVARGFGAAGPRSLHVGWVARGSGSGGPRFWITDAYAIVVSLQAPIYFRFLALISWSWVVMNHKRVYSQENARMHYSVCSQPAVIKGNMAKCILAGSINAFEYVLWETHSLFFCFDTAPDLL